MQNRRHEELEFYLFFFFVFVAFSLCYDFAANFYLRDAEGEVVSWLETEIAAKYVWITEIQSQHNPFVSVHGSRLCQPAAARIQVSGEQSAEADLEN